MLSIYAMLHHALTNTTLDAPLRVLVDVIMARVESRAMLNRFLEALQLHARVEYSIQSSHSGTAQCGYVDYHCTHAGRPHWEARPGKLKEGSPLRDQASKKSGCESRVLVHVPKSRWHEFDWQSGKCPCVLLYLFCLT
jgi:hypothetical protein